MTSICLRAPVWCADTDKRLVTPSDVVGAGGSRTHNSEYLSNDARVQFGGVRAEDVVSVI
jgi:hypothetical protein